MKKIFFIITICLITINSFANNLNSDSNHNTRIDNKIEDSNYFIIKLTIDNQVKEYKYNYNSTEDLFNTDIEKIIDSIEIDFGEIINDDCKVTISVTVSVGYGESYVSATVTMEADCATWKAELKKMKEDVTEMLK